MIDWYFKFCNGVHMMVKCTCQTMLVNWAKIPQSIIFVDGDLNAQVKK